MFKYLTCFLSFIVDKIGVYKIYKSLCFFFTHFFWNWDCKFDCLCSFISTKTCQACPQWMRKNNLVAQLTTNALLGDGWGGAIPWTGGWGRELMTEATPAARQTHIHISNSLRNRHTPVSLLHTHTCADFYLLLFSGNMT